MASRKASIRGWSSGPLAADGMSHGRGCRVGGRPSEAARPRATVGSDLPVSMLNDAHATARRWWRSLQPMGNAQEVRLVPRLQPR